jgi:transcriptional regulator with XRE-family HTH domain
MNVVKAFSRRLKAFREIAGLSQSGLAAKSGVALGTLQDYEHARYGPSLEMAVQLARALGQPLEAFLPSAEEDTGPAEKPAPKATPKRKRQRKE